MPATQLVLLELALRATSVKGLVPLAHGPTTEDAIAAVLLNTPLLMLVSTAVPQEHHSLTEFVKSDPHPVHQVNIGTELHLLAKHANTLVHHAH